ncbi:MAG: hypothetical protein H0T76_12030, partial [Nannocystis sp.]
LTLLLPVLLLVGACAAELAARSCEAVPEDSQIIPVPRDSSDQDTPVPEDRNMQTRPAPRARSDRAALALACQVAPALVLLASPEPAWRSFGLVLGFGGLLGFALATRAAPGLCALLIRLTREELRP